MYIVHAHSFNDKEMIFSILEFFKGNSNAFNISCLCFYLCTNVCDDNYNPSQLVTNIHDEAKKLLTITN